MKITLTGKKHQWLVREKPKEYWEWRGMYWVANIIAIGSFVAASFILNDLLYSQIASLITVEYFVGDIIIYHTIEKKTIGDTTHESTENKTHVG